MNNDEMFETQSEENLSLLARIAPSGISRRKLLIGSGVGALALVAAACGDDDGDDPASTGDDNGDDADGGGDDLATAAVAASLEVLAVNTYGAALDAATAGSLGEVPPAVAEYVVTAQGHHQAHLDAWNGVLAAAGEPEVTTPPAELEATVNEQFGAVTDVTGAAELALMLENIAANTYLAVIPTLSSPDAITLASTIQPIDMQHIAVLRFVLGEYPVPDTFAQTDMAFTGS